MKKYNNNKKKSIKKSDKNVKRKSISKNFKKKSVLKNVDKNVKKQVSKKIKKVYTKKNKQIGGNSNLFNKFIEEQQVPVGSKFKVTESREAKKDNELRLKKGDFIYVILSPDVDRMLAISFGELKKELDRHKAKYSSLNNMMKKFANYVLTQPENKIPKKLYGNLLGWVPAGYMQLYYEDDNGKDEYEEDELIEDIIEGYKNKGNNGNILKTANLRKK